MIRINIYNFIYFCYALLYQRLNSLSSLGLYESVLIIDDSHDMAPYWASVQVAVEMIVGMQEMLDLPTDIYFVNRENCRGLRRVAEVTAVFNTKPDGVVQNFNAVLKTLIKEKVNESMTQVLGCHILTGNKTESCVSQLEEQLKYRVMMNKSLISILPFYNSEESEKNSFSSLDNIPNVVVNNNYYGEFNLLPHFLITSLSSL